MRGKLKIFKTKAEAIETEAKFPEAIEIISIAYHNPEKANGSELKLDNDMGWCLRKEEFVRIGKRKIKYVYLTEAGKWEKY